LGKILFFNYWENMYVKNMKKGKQLELYRENTDMINNISLKLNDNHCNCDMGATSVVRLKFQFTMIN